MKREEFLQKFEAEAECPMILDYPERLVALAKLHKGQRLLTDLSLCRAKGMSFYTWIERVECHFPLHDELVNELLIKEMMEELEEVLHE